MRALCSIAGFIHMATFSATLFKVILFPSLRLVFGSWDLLWPIWLWQTEHQGMEKLSCWSLSFLLLLQTLLPHGPKKDSVGLENTTQTSKGKRTPAVLPNSEPCELQYKPVQQDEPGGATVAWHL